MTWTLRYRPGTPLGDRFPLWRFGRFGSAETADAVRVQCANADAIEIVEADQ